MTLSFGFIVGGDDSYYKNLMRACESLERVGQSHEIVILDMDDRLEIDDPKVKIVSGAAEKVENKDDLRPLAVVSSTYFEQEEKETKEKTKKEGAFSPLWW